MIENTHIIVGFTPYHLIPIAEIANQLDGNILIFHPTANALRLAPAVLNRCKYIGCGRSKVAKYVSAAHEIRRAVRERSNISVYAPHPFHTLSNYLLLSVDGVEKNIYQDGILNYYDAMTPRMSAAPLLGRRLRAVLIGLPYRKYSGHPSGIESFQAHSGYFTHPEKIVLRGSFSRVCKLRGNAHSGTWNDQQGSEDVTLFLDQPIERNLHVEHARKVRAAAETFTEELGMPVLYKPHHDQGGTNSMRSSWNAVSSDQERVPAEIFARAKNIRNVVGFFSSALVNIRMQNPSVGCYAVGANAVPIQIDGRHSNLGSLLSGFDVTSVDIDF